MRRPTVGSPAVTMSGMRRRFGSTSVSGPGQTARQLLGRGRPSARQARAPSRCERHARSAGWWQAGPLLEDFLDRRRHRARSRPARKRFPWETRPARRRGSAQRLAGSAPDRARAIPGGHLSIAGGLAGLAPYQIGVDQRIQIAVQHAVDIADRRAWCDGP